MHFNALTAYKQIILVLQVARAKIALASLESAELLTERLQGLTALMTQVDNIHPSLKKSHGLLRERLLNKSVPLHDLCSKNSDFTSSVN